MNAAAGQPPVLGHIVGGKYKLLALLGSGGMGAVFRAENMWTTRHVALKVMRPEHSHNPEAVARFMREARSSTSIAHPNIVDVFDMGQDPSTGAFYIVQELLTGVDLRHRLERAGRLAPAEALEIIVPIMGALVAAGRRGIVHRDIKPENIFLSRDGNGATVPKLIDFGISKIAGEGGGPSQTRTGFTMGTPNYMSPEQARGDSTIDERSDVWAIGVVLYEMLAGVCPFDDRTPNLVLVKILRDRPAPLDTMVSGLPAWLVHAVHRALAFDRKDRFATMHAFLSALLANPLPAQAASARTLSERFEASLRDHRAIASGEAELVELDEPPTELHTRDDGPTLVTPSPDLDADASRRRRAARGDDLIVSLPSASLPDHTLPPAAYPPAAKGMQGQRAGAPFELPRPADGATVSPIITPSRFEAASARRWVPVIAGAAVVLVAAAAFFALRGPPDAPASSTAATPSADPTAARASAPAAPSRDPAPGARLTVQGGADASAAPSTQPSALLHPPAPGRDGRAVAPPRVVPPVRSSTTNVARRTTPARDAGARAAGRPCGPLEPCARYP